MNAMAHVDVVIPLYNKSAVINRAMESVLAQTYPHWTLVVVDDGSTDDWAIDSSDARIVVVRQKNAGPGAARNVGASQGHSPYIAFLDADDEWLPEYLAHLVGILENDPSLAAASSSWFRGSVETDVNVKYEERGVGAGRWELTSTTPEREFKARVDSLHSSATVVRRAAFTQLGGFYENHSTFGEDSYFWTGLALTRPVYRSPEALLRFHVDASSLSVGRTTPYPIPPILTDPERVRSLTAPWWAEYMPQYFDYYVPLILGRAIDEGIAAQAFSYLSARHLRALGLGARKRMSIRIRVLTLALKKAGKSMLGGARNRSTEVNA